MLRHQILRLRQKMLETHMKIENQLNIQILYKAPKRY